MYADGPNAPLVDPAVVAHVAGLSKYIVTVGYLMINAPWLSSLPPGSSTISIGPGTRSAVESGLLELQNPRLSEVPRIVHQLKPDVAVVSGVQRGHRWHFAGGLGYAPELAASAGCVVVEVDEEAAIGPPIPGNVLCGLERPGGRLVTSAAEPSQIELSLAEQVINLIPSGATLQWGPGRFGSAIAHRLREPVHMHAGLVAPDVAKAFADNMILSTATTAYYLPDGVGTLDELVNQDLLRCRSVSHMHQPTVIGAIDRFVAINTALQIGLDGAVNVERADGREIAPRGGHTDFCEGAVLSRGGLSVIALASTTRSSVSTIVPKVERVSTPGSMVHIVVTEHGVADLRGITDQERIARVTAIAAPEYRAWLKEAANKRTVQ